MSFTLVFIGDQVPSSGTNTTKSLNLQRTLNGLKGWNQVGPGSFTQPHWCGDMSLKIQNNNWILNIPGSGLISVFQGVARATPDHCKWFGIDQSVSCSSEVRSGGFFSPLLNQFI